jgi:DNA-binding SARP family transcriptional activator
LHIRLLGAFQIAQGDEPITTVSSGRLQSLLAYLLLHHDVPQPRRQIAFSFWPDSSEVQARTNLRNLVHQLRIALPAIDGFLQADNQTLHWRSDRPFTLDLLDFEHAVEQAGIAERVGGLPAIRAALERAVQAYGGDLLPGCYDDWLLGERERLRQTYFAALERLIACLEQQREYAATVRYAERLLHHDPLRESTYRRLMRLHVLADNRASALRVYQECQEILRRELAVEPSPATRDIYARLVQPQTVPATNTRTGALAGETPLVGREREWQLLYAAWENAVRGQAGVVLVMGEAGIGKTRLAEELLCWAQRQGIATARARSYAAEGRLAYAPVFSWLRSAAIRPAIDQLDAVWRTEIARLLPALLVEDETLAHPEPLTESWQLQRFYRALAQATLGAVQPLLLLLDDVQWCDPGTLEWVHYLLRFDPGARLLLVGTVRDEDLRPDHPLHPLALELRREGRLTDVPLGPLDAEATVELAAHVAGREFERGAATRLYEDTEGHPLFIVETVRADGVASRTPRVWTEPDHDSLDARVGDRGVLPPKVQAVITARLAQLSPSAHELAGLAATIGREFTSAVLIEASASDEEHVVAALDELWQRQIVREQGVEAYDFSHDKIREVAYAELTSARRRLLHRRVALALQRVHAPRLDPVSGQLAAHYERSGEWEQAVAYYQRAAELAQEVYANADAIGLLRRGLALLERLPESAARDKRELALQTALCVSLNALKTFDVPTAGKMYGEESVQAYARVCELSQRCAIPIHPKVLRAVAIVFMARGQIRQALELGEQLLEHARQAADDPVLRTEAHYVIGAACDWLGQFPAAREHLETGLVHYDRSRHQAHIVQYAQDPGVICLSRLAYTLLHLGYPEQARRRIDEALALARELAHPLSLSYALNYVSLIALELWDLPTAQACANEMLRIAREHQLGTWHLIGSVTLGWSWVQTSGDREGIDLIRQGIAGDYASGQLLHVPHGLTLLADAYRHLGDVEEALDVVAEGLRLVEHTGVRFVEAELHRIRGELLLLRGESGEAENCLRRALAVAHAQTARLLELRAAVSLGRLLRQQDRDAEASEMVSAVYGWFNEGLESPDLRDSRTLLTTLQTHR